MGADNFRAVQGGKNGTEAFSLVVDNARYEYGHGGYTGTIAEKSEFTEVPVPNGMTAQQFVGLIEDGEGSYTVHAGAGAVYANKWGPALCVEITDQESLSRLRKNQPWFHRFFIFAGLASS